MRRLVLGALFSLLVLSALAAQEPAAGQPLEQPFTVSGSLRAELTGNIPADSSITPYAGNLLRLYSIVDLAPVRSARSHLDVEADFSGLSSSADSSLLESTKAQLNEAWLRADVSDTIVLLAGKRRIAWGTGFFNNPTDFVNPPKDPSDPEAQRMGVWSVQAGIYLPAVSIEQAAIIYDKLDSTGYAAKLSTSALIPSTDVNLVVFYAKPEGFKTGGSFDTSPFGDLPVLSGVNLHGELAVTSTWTVKALGGLRFLAPGTDTYFVAEYMYLDDSSYRHNLAFTFVQPNLTSKVSAFTDSLSAQATLLLNPVDTSALLRASIGSGYIENCTISLEGTWFLGPIASEFGSLRVGPTGLWGTIQLIVEVGY